MANRMGVSEQKYGPLENNYPHKVNSLDSANERILMYLETGNTEWLIDAANQIIIEALFPSVDKSHFRATDSDESPGLVQRQPEPDIHFLAADMKASLCLSFEPGFSTDQTDEVTCPTCINLIKGVT